MAEAFVNVTEGSGKKVHAFDRTIGANTVLDEVHQMGEQYLATYQVHTGGGVSIAVANDHVIQVMAGASLNLYVRRIQLYQTAAATTAAFAAFEILRLTTAGTGGVSRSVTAFDSTDGAAGATAMSLPTVKGTEGNTLWRGMGMVIQTVPTGGPTSAPLIFDLSFDQLRSKAIRVPAGAANGICIKSLTATAGCNVQPVVWFSEANF